MYWPIRSLASAGVRCGRCWADRRTLGASDGVATRILPIRSDRRHNKQGQRSPSPSRLDTPETYRTPGV